jgi:uroporphyrinogen-III synthase
MGMSLTGKTIVITRDIVQAKRFSEKIENHGAKSLQFPTIRIIESDKRDKIVEKINTLTSFDWIIFTSTNAVHYFFKYIDSNRREFESLKIGCVGQKTAEKLAAFNLDPTVIPAIYTSQDLLKVLMVYDMKDLRILLPVSNLSGRELEEGLTSRGATVDRIEIYKTVPFENPERNLIIEKIDKNELDCITFFSPSAINSFASLIGQDGISLLNTRDIAIAVIGGKTAQAADKKGLHPDIIPIKSDEDSFIQELERYFIKI